MSDRKPEIDAAAPLVEQIAAQLRTMATEGELTPGERLSEARLSADLGVSRNTLRESLPVAHARGVGAL